MAELLKTNSSLGTVIVERGETGLLVTIKTMAKKRVLSKEKISSVENGAGGGSIIGTRTVVLNLIGGERLVLKNVPRAKADELQRLLS